MFEITGETRLLSVIGHPVSHSLSPVIHNFFSKCAKLSFRYMAFDVTEETLGDFFTSAKTLNMAGFNVTMPLKEAVLPLLDIIDANAKAYRSVNTVVQKDGIFTGYNTDGKGFIAALHALSFAPTSGTALILGTGGAARTVAAALSQCGMTVIMASRRSAQLAPYLDTTYCAWNDLAQVAASARLCINATPIGMHGNSQVFASYDFLDALPQDAPVCDLIYAPRKTQLLQEAEQRGHPIMNGLSHLVHQAALSYGYFTGHMPEPDTIAEILAKI